MDDIKKDLIKDVPICEYNNLLVSTRKHFHERCQQLSLDERTNVYDIVIRDIEPVADSLDYDDKRKAWESFTNDLKRTLNM